MADFSYVKDYGLKFSEALTPRKKTVRIIEHHTSGGPGETVQGIHAYHLSKLHKGIDYNFCVLSDGTVVKGRGLEYCGGSVDNSAPRSKGMNNDSVAIVALGDFEHNQMPEAQKEGLKRITRDVAQYYNITEIIKHKDVKDTDCPGKFFPFDEIKAYALGGQPQPAPTPQPAPQPSGTPILTKNLHMGSEGDEVRMAQEQLAYHKAQPGKIDGIFGSKTKAAVIRFQKARIAEGDDLGSAGADGAIGPKTWTILMQGRK